MKHPVEKEIEEAIARGEFDHLPGQGKPLPSGDDGPGWWARRKVAELRRQDRIDDLRRSLDDRMGELWPLRTEEEVRDRVAEINSEIVAANNSLAEDDHLALLDPAAILALWRRMWRARG